MITRSRTKTLCVMEDISNQNRTAPEKQQRGADGAKEVDTPQQGGRYDQRSRDDAAKASSTDVRSPPCYVSDTSDNADEGRIDDPTFDADYANEIHEYLRSRESSTSVSPLYMTNHGHINEQMRQILVNFIIEVHYRFGLVPGTLYLTVNILDRYLSSEAARRVTQANLQLVGIVALLISSKFEEVWPISLTDCVCICENASHDERDVVDMETSILGALNYRINVPCAHAFLVRYLRAVDATTDVVNLSHYVLDGTLQSYYLLNFLPSQLAAAAVYISRKTDGEDDAWCPTLVRYARYREEDVLPVARAVIAMKTYCSVGLFAVNRKYGRGGCGGGASNVELCSDF
jgi:hypothetical protein